jgi:hypothetical protein
VASSTGDLATVERVVADLEAALASSGTAYYFVAHTARGTLAMLRGDVVAALRERRRAVELIDRIGMVYSRGIYRHHLAQLLAQTGQLDEASSVAAEAHELMRGAGYVHDEAVVQLVEAYVALAQSNTAECHRLLRKALAICRQTGYYTYVYPHGHALMPRLFAEALRVGIEVDYVRSAIRKCGFVPESPDVEGWPWPVEIYCLGSFDIRLGGKPVMFGGKRQRVPTSLLMALIALGGVEVAVEALADLLWPDAEGDAAEKALDITLHRLRKLLGDDTTLLRQHNRISPTPAYAGWMCGPSSEGSRMPTLWRTARLRNSRLSRAQRGSCSSTVERSWRTSATNHGRCRLASDCKSSSCAASKPSDNAWKRIDNGIKRRRSIGALWRSTTSRRSFTGA